MGNKNKGPLGTPLGNPLGYFNDQKQAALVKAEGGRSIMNHEIRNSIAPDTWDQLSAPVDTKQYPVGPVHPIDPKMKRPRKFGIRG